MEKTENNWKSLAYWHNKKVTIDIPILEVNPFCLLTLDHKVIKAYNRMINNHNSDLPL